MSRQPRIHAVRGRPSTGGAPLAPRVNVNTATPRELATLPGFGAATAERLLAYRERSGPIRSVEQLRGLAWWTYWPRRAEPFLAFD